MSETTGTTKDVSEPCVCQPAPLIDDLREDLKYAKHRVETLSALIAELETNPDAERIIKLWSGR